MPLLLADTGEIIWGCECYWGRLDEETISLAEKFGIQEIARETLSDKFKQTRAYLSLRTKIESAFGRSNQESWDNSA